MKPFIRSGFILLVVLAGTTTVFAAGDAEKGKTLYNICSACHGANAEGMAALNAPANAGQDPWYMTRQLKNFRAGIRGAHPDDTFGAQMRPMAMMLARDQDIDDVVAYISSLELPDPPPTIEGDIELGRQAYETCIPCHGEYGQGAQALDAPRLSSNMTGMSFGSWKTSRPGFAVAIKAMSTAPRCASCRKCSNRMSGCVPSLPTSPPWNTAKTKIEQVRYDRSRCMDGPAISVPLISICTR